MFKKRPEVTLLFGFAATALVLFFASFAGQASASSSVAIAEGLGFMEGDSSRINRGANRISSD